MASRPSSHGRPAALFAVAFVLLVVVLALLDHFGLPAGVLSTTMAGAVLVALAALGIGASTMQASEFYLAGRSVSAGANGMATAAAAISTLVFLGLGGTFLAAGASAGALVIGVALGLLLLTVGIAPYFRKSAAFGVVDFLGLRYGGRGVRVAAMAVVVPALIVGLTSALAVAAFLAAMLLGVSGGTALSIVTLVVMVAAVLGGLRAITRTAIVEYIVLAIAIAAPVAVVSLREYGWPMPPLTFGTAAKEAALLALAGGRDLAAPFAGGFAPAGDNVFAVLVVLATGVAALPHLLVRSATVRGADRARRSGAWALAAVLFVALMAPAYPAFARLVMLREVVDGPIESLPDWVFAFGDLGLVRICGIAATSVDAVLGACARLPGFTGNLNAGDLAVGSDAIVLAGPSIFGLPYVATALVAVGALAAALAAAKAMAFALASAIGHDLYAGAIDAHSSAGRQLIVTRLAAVVVIGLAAWFAAGAGTAAFGVAPAAIALSAGGLFPALILAVWWRRANATGAIAGIAAGGLLTATLIAEHRFPGFLPFGRLGFDDLTAGIVGMPAGFFAAVAATLASDPPSAERQVIIDAIRRPGGTPFVQEAERPMTDARRNLFPAIEPYAEHRLKVSDVHEIYVAEYGNPKGKPAVMIHGGPGAGTNPSMPRYHDPDAYRIVLFDQRGCGRSTPYAELRENTTWDLVADMERIREHLGIERWQLLGGSWGSTLALAYAETHPTRVTEMIVRGIFTLQRSELLWFYQEGASHLQPEAFEVYRNTIPEAERGDLIAAFHRRVTGDDPKAQLEAAQAWSIWEGTAISLLPDPGRVAAFGDPQYAIAFARIECHYFQNKGFFERDDQLLHNAGRLKGIPGTIVHGRYDLCTPISTAWDLHKRWPEADYRPVADAGHAMSEPGIVHELVSATEKYKR